VLLRVAHGPQMGNGGVWRSSVGGRPSKRALNNSKRCAISVGIRWRFWSSTSRPAYRRASHPERGGCGPGTPRACIGCRIGGQGNAASVKRLLTHLPDEGLPPVAGTVCHPWRQGVTRRNPSYMLKSAIPIRGYYQQFESRPGLITAPAATLHSRNGDPKVRLAEDSWNSRDPERVASAYAIDSLEGIGPNLSSAEPRPPLS
jgi:hypothetical protein